MFLEGIILTCAGMGTVFLFLALMIVVISRTSAAIRALEDKQAPKA